MSFNEGNWPFLTDRPHRGDIDPVEDVCNGSGELWVSGQLSSPFLVTRPCAGCCNCENQEWVA